MTETAEARLKRMAMRSWRRGTKEMDLVLGPWALQLTWRGWCIYGPNEYAYSQDFQRWRRRQQVGRAVKGAVRRLLGA